MATRLSQSTIQSLTSGDPECRVSQSFVQVLASVSVPVRASQVAVQSLVSVTVPIRASQVVIQALGLTGPCVTRRCQVWRIERTDGVVFRFTSHDEPVTYKGQTYSPCSSLAASASQSVASVGDASNMVLAGIIDDEAIREDDIQGGLFDDAYVEVWLVNWADGETAPEYRLTAGWLGQVSSGERGFEGEIIGPGGKLSQKPLVQQYTPTCRWQFGDSRCGVNRSALTRTGTVLQVPERGAFIADIDELTASAQYDGGTVQFLTGENAGLVVDVKSVEESSSGQVTIVLWLNAPLTVAAGDTFDLLPGCDQLKETCKGVYGNLINFGGFDLIPGEDAVTETPKAKF